jgi:hypothetical protein
MHAQPLKQEVISWLREISQQQGLPPDDAKWLTEITDLLKKEGKIHSTLAYKKLVCEFIALLLAAVPQLSTYPSVEQSLYALCKRNQLLPLLPRANIEQPIKKPRKSI